MLNAVLLWLQFGAAAQGAWPMMTFHDHSTDHDHDHDHGEDNAANEPQNYCRCCRLPLPRAACGAASIFVCGPNRCSLLLSLQSAVFCLQSAQSSVCSLSWSSLNRSLSEGITVAASRSPSRCQSVNNFKCSAFLCWISSLLADLRRSLLVATDTWLRLRLLLPLESHTY